MKFICTLLLVIAFSGYIAAGIVVTEFNFHQHDAINSQWTKSIDINNDGKIDFSFSGYFFFHLLTMTDSATTATCIIASGETPRFFEPGDSINGSQEFLNSGFVLASIDSAKMPIQNTTYIGFRIFNISSSTWHYGWLSIKLDWFHDIFYIDEAAYNDIEEMPIAAGQKNLSINEGPLSQIKILQTNSGFIIENLPYSFIGLLTIHDLCGRLLYMQEAEGPRIFISSFPTVQIGILTLTDGHDRYTRKVQLRYQ